MISSIRFKKLFLLNVAPCTFIFICTGTRFHFFQNDLDLLEAIKFYGTVIVHSFSSRTREDCQ